MTTRLLIILSSLLLSALPTFSWAQSKSASVPCQVNSKDSQLARDQRDTLRTECLKQNKAKISVSTCLKIATTMEYSTAAEEARLFCLQALVRTPQECFAITKAMEYPDSGDEARWDCLRRFSKAINEKRCLKIAESMSYPANADRAESYCKQQHD